MAVLYDIDSRLHAMVGNQVSLFGLRDETSQMHLGLEGGGYFSMRQEGRRFPLETADGLIGWYAEGLRKNWQWQTRYTHISAHLADGSNEAPIPYSRETVAVRLGWTGLPGLHLYGGLHYLVNTIPNLPPFALQVGGSWFAPDVRFTPFAAWDFRWRQAAPYNPSASIQLGVALPHSGTPQRSFRLFYAYTSGADIRGQFYYRERTMHSVGFEVPTSF